MLVTLCLMASVDSLFATPGSSGLHKKVTKEGVLRSVVQPKAGVVIVNFVGNMVASPEQVSRLKALMGHKVKLVCELYTPSKGSPKLTLLEIIDSGRASVIRGAGHKKVTEEGVLHSVVQPMVGVVIIDFVGYNLGASPEQVSRLKTLIGHKVKLVCEAYTPNVGSPKLNLLEIIDLGQASKAEIKRETIFRQLHTRP